MKPDPAATYFPYYFVIWALLGISSWLWIRSRQTPQEKKKWFDRFCIVIGMFVTGFICFTLVLWKQYFGIPIFLAAGVAITILNLRNTFEPTATAL
jgi:hypothetical protein